MAANEKLLKEFMDGWLKTVDFIKANLKEAVKIMSKGFNLPAGDVEGMMAGLRYADSERNVYFFNSTQPCPIRPASIFNDAGKYWLEVNIIEKPVPAVGRISPTACKYLTSQL